MVKTVTALDFVDKVLDADQPTLVAFSATWCGPCRILAPILADIASEQQQFQVLRVDIDADAVLTDIFGIVSVPTMLLFKDGGEVLRMAGAFPKPRILERLQPHLV